MTEDLFAGLPIGEKSRSTGRTITEGEFALLTDITWTIGELHSNAVYGMQHTSFGERALGGPESRRSSRRWRPTCRRCPVGYAWSTG